MRFRCFIPGILTTVSVIREKTFAVTLFLLTPSGNFSKLALRFGLRLVFSAGFPIPTSLATAARIFFFFFALGLP